METSRTKKARSTKKPNACATDASSTGKDNFRVREVSLDCSIPCSEQRDGLGALKVPCLWYVLNMQGLHCGVSLLSITFQNARSGTLPNLQQLLIQLGMHQAHNGLLTCTPLASRNALADEWGVICRFPNGESGADVYDRMTIFEDHLVRDINAGGRFNPALLLHCCRLCAPLCAWIYKSPNMNCLLNADLNLVLADLPSRAVSLNGM